MDETLSVSIKGRELSVLFAVQMAITSPAAVLVARRVGDVKATIGTWPVAKRCQSSASDDVYSLKHAVTGGAVMVPPARPTHGIILSLLATITR